MAKNVKVRFKSFLPGAGFDSAGAATQGKTRVVGTVTVTSYGGDGGESLSAIDIGLTTIDSIHLRVREEIGGNDSAPQRTVVYATASGHFYLHTLDGAGDGTLEGATVATAATETLEFDALGDSASNVELT